MNNAINYSKSGEQPQQPQQPHPILKLTQTLDKINDYNYINNDGYEKNAEKCFRYTKSAEGIFINENINGIMQLMINKKGGGITDMKNIEDTYDESSMFYNKKDENNPSFNNTLIYDNLYTQYEKDAELRKIDNMYAFFVVANISKNVRIKQKLICNATKTNEGYKRNLGWECDEEALAIEREETAAVKKAEAKQKAEQDKIAKEKKIEEIKSILKNGTTKLKNDKMPLNIKNEYFNNNEKEGKDFLKKIHAIYKQKNNKTIKQILNDNKLKEDFIKYLAEAIYNKKHGGGGIEGGAGMSEEDIADILKKLDSDNDGMISREELFLELGYHNPNDKIILKRAKKLKFNFEAYTNYLLSDSNIKNKKNLINNIMTIGFNNNIIYIGDEEFKIAQFDNEIYEIAGYNSTIDLLLKNIRNFNNLKKSSFYTQKIIQNINKDTTLNNKYNKNRCNKMTCALWNEDLFRKLDGDGTGTLDHKELREFLEDSYIEENIDEEEIPQKSTTKDEEETEYNKKRDVEQEKYDIAKKEKVNAKQKAEPVEGVEAADKSEEVEAAKQKADEAEVRKKKEEAAARQKEEEAARVKAARQKEEEAAARQKEEEATRLAAEEATRQKEVVAAAKKKKAEEEAERQRVANEKAKKEAVEAKQKEATPEPATPATPQPNPAPASEPATPAPAPAPPAAAASSSAETTTDRSLYIREMCKTQIALFRELQDTINKIVKPR